MRDECKRTTTVDDSWNMQLQKSMALEANANYSRHLYFMRRKDEERGNILPRRPIDRNRNRC